MGKGEMYSDKKNPELDMSFAKMMPNGLSRSVGQTKRKSIP
jgi:hypothetical protein